MIVLLITAIEYTQIMIKLEVEEANKRLYNVYTVHQEVEETMLITIVYDNKSKLSVHDFSRANTIQGGKTQKW